MQKNSSVGPSVRFSGDDDEQLIEFVSNHTILYDLKNPEFKNILKKDLIWEEAGKILNRTGKKYVLTIISVTFIEQFYNYDYYEKISQLSFGKPTQ